MKIRHTIERESNWAQLIAEVQTKQIQIGTEIDLALEGGEAVTAVAAAYLPAAAGTPAGVRFVFKDCLDEPRQMNKEFTNKGGYRASEGRRYILEEVYPRLPAELRALIRPRKITEIVNGETLVYEDPLWLPSETDMFGRGEESWQHGAADGPDDFQLDIFKAERDRVKQRRGYGTTPHWCRSVDSGVSSYFCLVGSDGSATYCSAYYSWALAPGFDL